MYGIGPTHREEWRRKQRVRLFFEERIIELQDLFLASFGFFATTCEATAAQWPKIKRTVRNNKEAIVCGLVVVLFVSLLCI